MTEKLKILIVDDRKENLVALRQVLSDVDADVIEASSGNQALAETLVHDFAMAILDVQMPGMDGYELGELLRSDSKTAHLPVIFMTAAYGEEIQVFKGYEAGAVDYIVKPYNSAILLAKVRVFLDMHRTHKELAKRVFDLAASEERYRTLVATVPDIVYRIDPEGRFTFLNDAVRALGYRPEELIGLPFAEIVFPEDVENVSRRFVLTRFAGNRTGDEGAPKLFDERRRGSRQTIALEVRLVSRRGGRIVPAELYSRDQPVLTAEVNSSGLYTIVEGRAPTFLGTVGIIRDITQRKEAEAELFRYHQRLEKMVEERTAELSTANVQLQKEVDERTCAEDSLRESEGRFKDLFNYMTEGVAIYKAINDGKDFIFFDINKAGEKISAFNKKDVMGQSLLKMFPGVKDMGLFEVFQQVWETGVPIFHPLSLYKDVRLEQWVQNWVYKLPSGEIIAIYSDGTIRKKAEEERLKLEEQLRQSQKMEAIGTLAGGVAHDFNNILTTIIGNAQLALMDIDKEGPLREEIEEIKKAGERAASLTRQLLAFSRKQIVQPKILDLNEVIADLENMIGRLIGEDVDLLMLQRPGLWQVEADPSQIEQILMNLTVNAKDAMPMGGKLTIETANVDLDDNYFRNHGIKEAQPGAYVMLAVSDTGIGMDKETQEHIFEPFFTTKGIGKGTGLGLSTVYGIVKQNKGLIWAYSEPGQGSAFKIYLPRVKGDIVSEKKEPSPVAGLGGSESILVVEDDDSLRKLARIVLEQNGYKVLEAEDGEDALRVAEAHHGSIDLMITDVVMPKMGGKEVAKRLQPLYPRMKVLYMSGYTDDAIAHHGILDAGLNFIEKPFSPNVLACKVREILNK